MSRSGSGMTLTDAERARFADYLEEEARSDNLLAAQCNKIGEVVVAQKLRTEAACALVIARKLRSTESHIVTIGG